MPPPNLIFAVAVARKAMVLLANKVWILARCRMILQLYIEAYLA
jgi:hypothetical protein